MITLQILGITQAAAAHLHPPPEGEELVIFQFLIGARWIHFASVFVLFGSSFFWFYIGSERFKPGPGGLRSTLRTTTGLLRIAAVLAAISGVAWLVGLLASMTTGFANVMVFENWRLFFFETPFGTVSIVRLALLALGIGLASLPWTNRAWLAALLLVGALLLISQAWLGHAAEGGAGLYGTVMITIYCVHVLSAGAWVGGLPPLLLALKEQRRFLPEDARRCSLDILSRFSLMAMVAVTLIVASGIITAGFRVAGSYVRLYETSYGDALFAKIAIVTVMLALAYFNRFIAMPRLRAASLKGMVQIVRLGHSVTLELALSVLVIGVAAVLGLTPPPQ